ncbi:MAG TPA: histidinol-phosphate transaminase [Myxococcaceae bacterium]|nr:histidinol-phosphate transaminase [Myxococcaceae bacterium]
MSPARPRPVLAAVPLYAPDPSPVEIDLSDNVNLWGVPPAAARVLRDPLAAQPSVYPRSDPVELREALARYAGVSAAQVVTGCGSDDVIDGALRAFAAPGEKVAYSAPSFSMLVSFARVNGLEPAPVPFAKNGDVDPDAVLAQRAAITYVCSPNNPTGSGVSAAALERVVTRAEGLVLVDEAYGEFSGQTAVSLLARAPQLLVTRTLSKAFGLAGLRVGYGLAAPEVVQVLEKVRGPYKVNVLGEKAALAALREDVSWVRRHVEESVAIRERLRDALEALGLRALPSSANFLCLPVPDSAALGRALLGRGIKVRVLRGLPGIGDAVRVGVGPWGVMERLLAALREVLR